MYIKTLKQLFVFLITSVMLLFAAMPAFAAKPDEKPDYSKLDYYISSYDVQIDVAEDNILYITEKISVYFNVYSHGIYRYIPLSNEIKREDGTSGKTTAKIKNVSVSDFSDSSRRNGNYVIQIGSKGKEIIGAKDYTISYSYVMGRDIGNGFDELYYNIIGKGWKTYIQNVTFSITMPKEFDKSKLGFSAGNYGASGTGNIEYSVDGNKISGRLTKELAPNQALTVRIELPDNYFSFNYAKFYTMLALEILIPAVVLLAVLILWIKYGKDKKVVKKTEYYPPDGMSSLDVAFWQKGYVENRDVVPLMIELANEGYIDIGQKIVGKPDFIINQIRKYDGDDENKKIFFKGLFSNGGTCSTGKFLKNSFYLYVEKIVENMNTAENKEKVFSEKSLYLRIYCWIASVLSIIASIVIAVQITDGFERVAAALIGIVAALCAFGLSFFIRKRTDEGHKILLKIIGFKTFLENAQKDSLEKLAYDNPSYYYDILPYAYVLGVSDVWTEKFEEIAVKPPVWYGSSEIMDRISFYGIFSQIMHFGVTSMASAPQSGSGGGGGFSGGGFSGSGFSGGGFAGGGSGGGGGGRW